MRSPPTLTGICSSSASSTIWRRPASVLTALPAFTRGFCAATSSRAISRTDPGRGRWRRHHQLANRRTLRDRVLLNAAVGDEQHRRHRRCHHQLVGAEHAGRELRQAVGLVVPLHVAARHVGHVGGVVRRHGALDVHAGNHEDRHTVAVGVVDGHRSVLNPDHAVQQHEHRTAFDLGVAVRHGHRGFLVQRGQKLRCLVVAVVDDRLVESLEARAGIGGRVVEAERANDVHHVVGLRVLDQARRLHGRRRRRRIARELRRRWRRGCRPRRRSLRCWLLSDNRC